MERSTWKNKRSEWVSARNGFGLKSGMAKDVSLGDAIDDVYDAWDKSLYKLGKALKALKKDIGAYKSAVRDRYPAAAQWLTDNLERDTIALEKAANDTAIGADSCIKEINIFRREKSNYAFPDGEEFVKAWRRLKSPDDWKAESAPLYQRLRTSADNFRRFASRIKLLADGITVTVPGKVNRTTFMDEVDTILNECQALEQLMTTQDIGGEAFLSQARYCRDTYTIIFYSVSKLGSKAEALMGLPDELMPPRQPNFNYPSSG